MTAKSKQKSLSALIAVSMLLSMLPGTVLVMPGSAADADNWSAHADTSWYDSAGGDKTAYEISTAEQLAGLAKLVNEGNTFQDKTVTLTADISLSGKEWTPIGIQPVSSTKQPGIPFSGTFDGGNRTITGLTFNQPEKGDAGLFGYSPHAVLKNLTFKDVTIHARTCVGALCAYPMQCTVENITLTGLIQISGFSYVGSVAGYNMYGPMTNVTVNADDGSYVKVNSIKDGVGYRGYGGGVIGFCGEGKRTYSNITSNIPVYSTICDVGGITGIAHSDNIFEKCSSSGDVYLTEPSSDDEERYQIGGIAGTWHNESGCSVTFTDCSYTGKLHLVGRDDTDLSDQLDDDALVGSAYMVPPMKESAGGSLIIDGQKIAAIKSNHQYTDLAAAAADAQPGDSIYMLQDSADSVSVTQNFSIWNDGYTLDSAEIAEGSGPHRDAQGNVVAAAAKIDSTYYETVEKAVDAANEMASAGSRDITVELQTDAVLAENTESLFDGTLDLGGRTLTANYDESAGSVSFTAGAGHSLTVRNGSVTGTADSLLSVLPGGELTIEDCTITSKSQDTKKAAAGVTNSGGTLFLGTGTEVVNKAAGRQASAVCAGAGETTIDGASIQPGTGTGVLLRNTAEGTAAATVKFLSGTIGGENGGRYGVTLSDSTNSKPHKFVMSGGSIEGCSYGAYINNIGTFEMSGGSITGCATGISGNGADLKQNTSILISGEAVIDVGEGYLGIYQPQNGTIKVSGSARVSGDTAIGMKSGTLEISGGTLEGVGTFNGEHSLGSSGIATDSSAVVVDDEGGSYFGHVKVIITGGTLISEQSSALSVIRSASAGDDEHPVPEISVSGDTARLISGKWGDGDPMEEAPVFYLADGISCEPVVSGGHFSLSVEQYVVDSLTCELHDTDPEEKAPFHYAEDTAAARSQITEPGSGEYRDMTKQDDPWHRLHAVKVLPESVKTSLPAAAFSGDVLILDDELPEGESVIDVTLNPEGEFTRDAEAGTWSFTMPDADVTVTLLTGERDAENHSATLTSPPVMYPKVDEGVTGIEPEDLADASADIPSDSQSVSDAVKQAKESIPDDARDRLNKQLGEPLPDDQEIYIHVITEVEFSIRSFDAAGGEMSVDITPKYDIIASTEKRRDDIVLGENAVELLPNGPAAFDIKEPVQIVIPVPALIAEDGDRMLVKHDHGGVITWYAPSVSGGKITFTDRTGFSLFTLKKLAEPALTDLSVEPGTLNPAFDPETDAYSVSVDSSTESARLLPEAPDGADITVRFADADVAMNEDGTFDVSGLKTGGNEITVTVTYPDGSSATYTVTVNRAAPHSSGGGSSSSGSSDTVKVKPPEHGRLSVSSKRARPGETVTVTPEPDKGWKMGRFTLTDKKGGVIELTPAGDGTYTFVMPERSLLPVTLSVVFAEDISTPGGQSHTFEDVPADAWFAEAVQWAVDRDITTGTSANAFSPFRICTRGEISTFLWRLAGQPAPQKDGCQFTDVAPGSYCYDAVRWAAESGVVKGITATVFKPDDICTRAMAMALLYRYDGAPASTGTNPFSDVPAGQWYTSAVIWGADKDITAGTGGGCFSPDRECTRAEIVTMLYRWDGIRTPGTGENEDSEGPNGTVPPAPPEHGPAPESRE